jgi:RNA-directed DNA polymerase
MAHSSLNLRTTRHLALRLGVSERWLKHLADTIDQRVTASERQKSSGGTRRIYEPSKDLKRVQRLICKQLLQPLHLPDVLHGSVPGRSPRTNAQPHVGKPIVASLDIKDFYPSIRYDRVYSLFLDLGCSPDVARLLTKLTTYGGHLAQGFPSSSAIANLILARIVPRVSKLCSDHGLTLTLYQDDLTISGGHRIPDLLNLCSRILRQSGFDIKPSKTKVVHSGMRQEVTGWVVNQKVNVSKDEYRHLRALLNRCRVQGIERVADRPVPKFKNHIRGRIQRVIEVNPKRGNRLLEEFRQL